MIRYSALDVTLLSVFTKSFSLHYDFNYLVVGDSDELKLSSHLSTTSLRLSP